MSIAQALVPEFDHEMQTTRTMLERVPEGQKDWKPHEKSMSMGQLAAHIGEVPMWVAPTLTGTELDMNPPGGEPYQSPGFTTVADLLAGFDASVRSAREAITGTSDADFMVNWSLKNGGEVFFTMPRVAVIRSFVMNHLIHHRGQLSVYLRLTGVPVPSTYGPSADEGNM